MDVMILAEVLSKSDNTVPSNFFPTAEYISLLQI